MEIILQIDCINCDAEINRRSLHLTDEKIPVVNVYEFMQTIWKCPECGTENCIGDINIMGREDL